MKLQKTIAAMTAAAAISVLMAVPALAATEYEEITDLSFEIYSTIEEGTTQDSDSVEVTLETDGCDVTSYTVTNVPSSGWDSDSKPKLRIVVEAQEDYRFMSGLGKDDVYISDDQGEVTSVNRSSKKVTVSITLPEVSESAVTLDDDFSLDIDEESLGWDDYNRGVAYWDYNDYAKKYQVKVYRDGSDLTASEPITTTNNTYDLSAYFKRGAGEYTFRVRAVLNSSNEGDWVRSREQSVTAEEAAAIYAQRTTEEYKGNSNTNNSTGSTDSAQHNRGSISTEAPGGQWQTDNTGTWWKRLDGSWPYSQWVCINGAWYWFNASGYRSEKKWEIVDGVYYYLGEGGVMAADCLTPDGYWVDASGAWDTSRPQVVS